MIIPVFFLTFLLAIVAFICRLFLTAKNRALQMKYPLPDISEFTKRHSTTLEIRGKMYRIVYVAHELGPKIPLVVFLHGLGAQVAQFKFQLQHFTQIANVLAVDLLGHGLSQHSSRTKDFDLSSMAEDLVEIMARYKLSTNIIVAHSMGAALSVLMYQHLRTDIDALVLLGPRYNVSMQLRRYGYMPVLLLDLYRYFDQRKELLSAGVRQFLAPGAPDELKRKQFSINLRSSSLTLTRILRNIHSFPSSSLWHDVECPVLLLVGDSDHINPLDELLLLQKNIKTAKAPTVIQNSGHNIHLESPGMVNAIICRFLVDECGITTMDATVQLRDMATIADKWSMKNYAKWKRTPSVSLRVGESRFYGMKVLRDGDDEHSPRELKRSHPNIGCVIDISHQAPPYTTESVNYRKVATVSKIPPSLEDVQEFIRVADRYLDADPGMDIAVHCHYGHNRTGFMVCSYLIERCGYSVTDALQAWETAREKGIKHGHFRNELFLRYSSSK